MKKNTTTALVFLLSIILTLNSYAKISDNLAVKKVSIGNGFSVALLNDESVWIWGNLNENGVISKPIEIANFSNIKDISCGDNFCVALKDDGSVYLIGYAGWSDTSTFLKPSKLDGFKNIEKISAGGNFILAVDKNKDLFSIGENSYGQLGIGTLENLSQAKKVEGLNNIVSISAGLNHSYAIDDEGLVWSWGNNENGQLSRGVLGGIYKKPGKSAGLKNVKSISSSNGFSIFVRNDGLLYSVGLNDKGQLGLGDYDTRNIAQKVSYLSEADIKSVSTGSEHVIAIDSGTEVFTWGNNNKGQLGKEKENSNLPDSIPLKGGVGVFAGGNNSAILKADGKLWFAGENIYGQFGDEIYLNSSSLNQINLDSVSDFAVGSNFTIAIDKNGNLYGWGLNHFDQISSGEKEVISSPILIEGVNNPVSVDTGEEHTVMIDKNKNVYTWGSNKYYQLGNEAGKDKTKVDGISNINKIAAGAYHNLALDNNGNVWAWGNNQYGQLGNESYVNSYKPLKVAGVSDIVDIKAGQDFSIALDENGNVWAWGNNQHSQLGVEGFGSYTPVKIDSLNNIKSINSGKYNVLAVDKNSDVWVWGGNYNKEIPLSDEIIETPIKLNEFLNIKEVSVGDTFTAFLNNENELKVSGELALNGDFENIIDIESGDDFIIFKKSDNKLYSTGYNNLGQLGIGSNNLKSDFVLSSIYKKNNTGIIVLVNLNELVFDVDPIIKDSRTLVPLRGIFEYLDVSVEWDQETRSVTCTKDGKTVIVKIDSDIATVNGEEFKMDTKAIIKDSRTLIPLRFVSESLGAYVDWDNESRTVIIVE
jgi:alpha-tubulin suppressor-like RCC1 family protein